MNEQRAIEIENGVRNAIQQVCDTLRDEPSSTVLTRAIRRSLTQLAHDFGYKVRNALPRTDPKQSDIGWLWDLSWIESDRDNTLRAIPLALESEWNSTWDEILWDFQKLLVSQADIRVMVLNTATDAQKQFAQLRAAVDAYSGSRAGDHYLFACWCYARRKNRPRVEFAPYIVRG
jgi:hypothetical protein